MAKDTEAKPVDSAIWTSAATTSSPFAQLRAPENLDELAQAAIDSTEKELAERLKPYETPVTQATLSKQLK